MVLVEGSLIWATADTQCELWGVVTHPPSCYSESCLLRRSETATHIHSVCDGWPDYRDKQLQFHSTFPWGWNITRIQKGGERKGRMSLTQNGIQMKTHCLIQSHGLSDEVHKNVKVQVLTGQYGDDDDDDDDISPRWWWKLHNTLCLFVYPSTCRRTQHSPLSGSLWRKRFFLQTSACWRPPCKDPTTCITLQFSKGGNTT